jgi:hypothetical protein
MTHILPLPQSIYKKNEALDFFHKQETTIAIENTLSLGSVRGEKCILPSFKMRIHRCTFCVQSLLFVLLEILR